MRVRKEKTREPHRENHEEDDEDEELAPVANGDALRDPYAMVISEAVRAPAGKERGQGQHAWEGVCGSTISHAQYPLTYLVLCMASTLADLGKCDLQRTVDGGLLFLSSLKVKIFYIARFHMLKVNLFCITRFHILKGFLLDSC